MVSRDSIVDDDWLRAGDWCKRYRYHTYRALLGPTYETRENVWGGLPVRSLQPRGKTQLILTVKIETRHPVGGSFSNEFSAFVIIAEIWRLEVARAGNSSAIFKNFWKKTRYGKIFKKLFWKFSSPHRSTLLCSNVVKIFRPEIGEIVRYLPDIWWMNSTL